MYRYVYNFVRSGIHIVSTDRPTRAVSNSYSVIFSNWLLMYLSDEELGLLVEKMLGWLAPGGLLFFRESCNHQSGTRPEDAQAQHGVTPSPH